MWNMQIALQKRILQEFLSKLIKKNQIKKIKTPAIFFCDFISDC